MSKSSPHPLPRALLHPRHWAMWLGVAAMWLFAQLPHRAGTAIGSALGAIARHLARARRRFAERNLALCIADSETRSTPVITTADYAYFRLRDEGYTEDHITRWAETIKALNTGCRDIFVYFKHEEEGKGPYFGEMLKEKLAIL